MGWFGKIAISEMKGCARLYILEPKKFDVSGRELFSTYDLSHFPD
jgi:hypothetical protein